MLSFALGIILPLLSASGDAESAHRPLVVIDPGHGGYHVGAIGACGLKEKDVTLAIGTELSLVLDATQKVRTHLTRSTDMDIELMERPAIANQLDAALFISVHANASRRAIHRGVETFFLSAAGSQKRISELAKRENRGYQEETGPQGGLDNILWQLHNNAAHQESQNFAVTLQETMVEDLNVKARGVLQERFVVLKGAQMPAALVEVGFLTNPAECELLKTEPYRRKVARALGRAILAFIATREPVAAQG